MATGARGFPGGQCPAWRSVIAHLVDDVDAIAQPLSPQDGVQIVEPVAQVVLPVSEGDDDCHCLGGGAVGRRVAAAQEHPWVLPLHPLQGHG